MISYITLGSDDVQADAVFFDTVLGAMGCKRAMEFGRGIIWGSPAGQLCLGLISPFNRQPATAGNGNMVALNAESREEVDRLWQLALDNGGSDEGAPGERMPGFYAAYFRSPKGHKMALVKIG